jgi:hypothetical protein
MHPRTAKNTKKTIKNTKKTHNPRCSAALPV